MKIRASYFSDNWNLEIPSIYFVTMLTKSFNDGTTRLDQFSFITYILLHVHGQKHGPR